MKIRRNLLRVALLSYALIAATATGKVSAAVSLDQCGPDVWSCNTATNCAVYCEGITGSPRAICNRAHCCVCLPV